MSTDLSKANSSFMSSEQRAALIEDGRKAGEVFRKKVASSRESGLVEREQPRARASAGVQAPVISDNALRELAERAAEGDREAHAALLDAAINAGQSQAQGLISEGDLISDSDMQVDKTWVENEQESTAVEPTMTTEDGTVICNHCNQVVERPKELELDDDTMMNYFLGGRITKDFRIGKFRFSIQSLTDTEIRLADERVAEGYQNGAFSNELEIRQFRGLCLLCFSITSYMGTRLRSITHGRTEGGDQTTSINDVREEFEKRLQMHMSRGHHLQVRMSRKSEELETAILMALEDEERVKN